MPKTVRNVVGPQLRRIRNRLELSQAELAVRLQLAGLDWGRVAVAKIESRIKRVNDAELFMLARVLKVEMTELFPRCEKVKDYLAGQSPEP